jgi:hypothetical protein
MSDHQKSSAARAKPLLEFHALWVSDCLLLCAFAAHMAVDGAIDGSQAASGHTQPISPHSSYTKAERGAQGASSGKISILLWYFKAILSDYFLLPPEE